MPRGLIVLLASCLTVGVVASGGPTGPCAPSVPGDADRLRVMTWNIGHGRGTAINQLLVSRKKTYRNLDRIAAVLERSEVDVVALQEADGPSRWSGGFDHVEHVAVLSGLTCAVHGVHAEGGMFRYGTALLSRRGLREARSHRFPPSRPTLRKGFVRAVVDWRVDGRVVPVTVVSVHLDYSRESVREVQVAEMIAELTDSPTPRIVMGDLNAGWERDDSIVRELAAGLRLQPIEPEAPGFGTYKSADGKRLDWILISDDLRFTRHEVLRERLSDHLAVLADVELVAPGDR